MELEALPEQKAAFVLLSKAALWDCFHHMRRLKQE